MASHIEYRQFQREIRSQGEGDAIVFAGMAAPFNTPADMGDFMEVFAPGAFTDSLLADDVLALFGHDTRYVLGRVKNKTLDLSETDEGLIAVMRPLSLPWVQDLALQVTGGYIDQMSVAFSAESSGQRWVLRNGVDYRIITRARLYDVSVLADPAYVDTHVALRSRQTLRGPGVREQAAEDLLLGKLFGGVK